jgi:prevent-host-death family protein
MFDITKDIHSVTTFRRNPGQFMKQLKKNKRPVVLTVKGKAEAVVQDAQSYQRLLDIVARADVYEAIRQGLDDVERGPHPAGSGSVQRNSPPAWHTALNSRIAPNATSAIFTPGLTRQSPCPVVQWFRRGGVRPRAPSTPLPRRAG